MADGLSQMLQYKSGQEVVVHSIIPPQQAAQAVNRQHATRQAEISANDLTQTLKAELLTDPWFSDHQQLFSNREGVGMEG